MPEDLDTSRFALPPGALINALEFEGIADGRSQLLQGLQARIESGRAGQKEWTRNFDQLYDEAVRGDYSAPLLVRWAAALLDRQKAVLEQFNPIVEALQQTLSAYSGRPDPEPEVLDLYRAIFDLAIGWVAPYQELCRRLLELTAKKKSASHEIVRARPIEGDIDYAELSREHIARYPRIRAALAE
jgi:hypothetical protein